MTAENKDFLKCKSAWERGDLQEIKELYGKGMSVKQDWLENAKQYPHVCEWLSEIGLPFYLQGFNYYLLPADVTKEELVRVDVAWDGTNLVKTELSDWQRRNLNHNPYHKADGSWYEYYKGKINRK